VAEEETLLSKFLDQLRQPLIMLLLGSAVVSALLGSYDDAVSITLVRPRSAGPVRDHVSARVPSCSSPATPRWRCGRQAILIVSTVAFVQEWRSEQSLAALNKLVPYYCTVVRGVPQTISASQLVPGDLVRLQAGDRIPADIRLLEVRSGRLERPERLDLG